LITDILIGDIFNENIDALWPLLDEQRSAESLPVAAGTA
jgi:hypothetical protein